MLHSRTGTYTIVGWSANHLHVSRETKDTAFLRRWPIDHQHALSPDFTVSPTSPWFMAELFASTAIQLVKIATELCCL